MISLVARYRARAGAGDAVAAALARHVAASRREPGCVLFVACRDRDEPDVFMLVEQYTDEAALDAHRGSEHFRHNVLEAILPQLEERVARLYDEVLPAPQ